MRKINISVKNFNLNTLRDIEVAQIFKAYKDAGIILTGSLDSNKWQLTDEYENCTFNFNISKDDFIEYETNLDLSLDDFVFRLKAYILTQLGDINLNTLRQFLCDLKKVIAFSYDDLSYELEDANIHSLQRIFDFFNLIKTSERCEDYRYILESIRNNIIIVNSDRKRLLASFNSYFLFEDLIQKFWKESQDEDERLFFFPIWYWWRLSTILPTRPREIVLTPRNCLRKQNKEWYLTVRKDNKKGNNKKKTYKIDTDYSLFSFVITEDFASDIKWYLDKTSQYERNELNTLFITETHYKRWERSKPYNSRYFTYINLNTCLRYFFEFIVQDYYGYELIDDISRKHLSPNQIHKFCLGDTRHLSLIGVIFSGAPASVAKVLAGHDSIDIGSHYYTNIASFVETQTYRNYKRLTTKERFSLSEYRQPIGKNFVKVSGGNCYSINYSNGIFSDCLNSIGSNGEIGNCPNCPYFRTSGRLFSNSKEEYENKINSSYKALKMTTQAIRKAKGYEEDISRQLYEINNLANEYSKYLMETEGEGTWQDQQV